MAEKTENPGGDRGRGRQQSGTDPASRPLDLGREPRGGGRNPVPTGTGPGAPARAEPKPFAVYLDLAGNEWRTWDAEPGLGPLPRQLLAGTDATRGWVFKVAFDEAARTAEMTAADLAIAGRGRYLHLTGQAVGPGVTFGPDFTAVLAAFLGGLRGPTIAQPGRTVVYHPGGGDWVRVEFATSTTPARSGTAPAGRKPKTHEVFSAEVVTNLAALRAVGQTPTEAAARLQPILDALVGKSAAQASQARDVTSRVNALLDAAGLVLHYDGRPVRLSVVNLKKTAGSFRLRTLGTKSPEAVCTSRTFPAVTVTPASH